MNIGSFLNFLNLHFISKGNVIGLMNNPIIKQLINVLIISFPNDMFCRRMRLPLSKTRNYGEVTATATTTGHNPET